MNIAIVGYGRMGKTIERIAIERGHSIVLKVDRDNAAIYDTDMLQAAGCDVVIEFSLPSTALQNITTSMAAGIPHVSGTTAWLHDWPAALQSMKQHNGTLLYASNFSVGVNILFAINKKLATLMNAHDQYESSIHEVHHTGKLDAPSGTAITLAQGIIENMERKTDWSADSPTSRDIAVTSERVDPAPGTHHVMFESDIDSIELIHTAKSRDGFALGAILAAEYLMDKKGLHTMADVLQL